MIESNTIHRRHFLSGCLVTAGAGLCTLSGVDAAQSVTALACQRRPTNLTLAMLTKEKFDPCLGSSFSMEIAPNQTETLELVEINGYPSRASHTTATRDPFSLVFRASGDLQVSQQIFKLRHPVLGDHEIFLVPIGQDEKGLKLEAVFS